MVTEKCPSTLICSAEEVNKGVAITMTLEFANLSDYTNKIGQILGKTPGIYFDASNSIFKRRIYASGKFLHPRTCLAGF